MRLWTKYYDTSSSDRFVSSLRKIGIEIGEGVVFRSPKTTTIDRTRPSLIEMGNNIDINANFTIMTHDFGTFVFRNLFHDFVSNSGKVKLGNNIYIGLDVTILRGVTIGNNVIIGLGSVVTKNIPDNTVCIGSPCKVVCSLEDYYQKRKVAEKDEAILYAHSIRDRYQREPIITDFKEEWTVFFRKKDYEKYPEMHKIIDWRLRDSFDDYWTIHKTQYEGFEAFLEDINT